MKRIRLILSHLTVSLLLVLLVLVVLDAFNPAMGFLNSGATKVFYLVLSAVGLYTAISRAWEER